MSASPRILSAVPTFLVEDIGSTARWYAENLGFRVAGAFPKEEPHVYASLMRDGAEIMLLRVIGHKHFHESHLRPEGLWDAYIRMSGVKELYASMEGQAFIRMPLKKQPYGDWEFEVTDPNGYVLVFGGDVDE